ncbi:uncharacterized protein LOC111355933 [Spodoptera litura]|uniref:Uncharacterized protein LOC111355933 n=1 Tax=Spodoptera litura TaxID=69820 RepID=A0A9J7IUT4_SPOLT|nr:uncharacterized protein LOC111355933 [Spodoptera litura]
MSYFWKVLLVIIVFIKQEADLALTLRKFVHQKDMSEHCRRRVMPSVFLGKQVVDAYSQILHFSQLELPYSCFIGVRTESGSNIILVIQLVSNKTLIDSCRKNKNQLLVYELGETFGGYWGALPHGIMDAKPKEDEQQYTIKTTQPTTTTEKKTTTHTPPPTTSTTESEELKPVKQPKDYIVEIPIVNVSFQLVPGQLPPKAIFDTEDSFDKFFDVKPWPNITYKTTVLPLLQFSLEDEDVGGALRTPVAVEPELPEFQVDFNSDIFTPDYRLPYPVFNLPTKRPQHKYNVNHRLNFNKNKMLLAEKQSLFLKTSLPMFPYHTFVSRPQDVFTSHYRTSQSPLNKKHSESWDAVNAILKNLNRSEHVAGKTKVDDTVAKLLQGLAKIGHNVTGLAVNTSSVKPSVTASWHSTTEYKTDSITWRQPSATYRTNYLDDEIEEPVTTQVSSSTASNIDDSIGLLLPIVGIDTVILNITQPETNEPSTLNESESTTLATTSIEKSLTLLDHESWENMVHAASLMAVALNQSVTAREDVDTQGDNVNVTISTLRQVLSTTH